MTSVLYFHGFASSPASAKITALRPLLEPHAVELHTPDLNAPSFEKLDWKAMVERAVSEARRTPPEAMVGSSLGALVAIAVAKTGIHVPLVLIAPALGVARRWQEKIPDTDPVKSFQPCPCRRRLDSSRILPTDGEPPHRRRPAAGARHRDHGSPR